MWGPSRLTVAAVGNNVGLALIVTAWWTTSGARSIPHQLAWLNIGVVGLILAGVSNLAWLGEGRRVLRRERSSVLAPAVPIAPTGSSATLVPMKTIATRVGSSSPGSAEQMVSAPGTLRYHRPGCVLVRGKAVTVHTGAGGSQGPTRACEVCRP
jgi:hypothetical protein